MTELSTRYTAHSADSGAASPLGIYEAKIEGWRPLSKDFSQNARHNRWTSTTHKQTADWRAYTALHEAGWPHWLAGVATVTITVSQQRGPLLDGDNLQACCKRIRDLISRYLGRDDGPRSGLDWEYAVVRGPDGVNIRLEEG